MTANRTATPLPDEVYELHPAVVLPGESLPEPATATCNQFFYDMLGRPLPGTLAEQTAARLALRQRRDARHRSSFFRGGVHILISTAYLGYGAGEIWETMIFIDGRGELTWRYFTPGAALRGHRIICATMRRAQHRRRVDDTLRAPRRGGTCRVEHPGVTCNQYMELRTR